MGVGIKDRQKKTHPQWGGLPVKQQAEACDRKNLRYQPNSTGRADVADTFFVLQIYEISSGNREFSLRKLHNEVNYNETVVSLSWSGQA